ADYASMAIYRQVYDSLIALGPDMKRMPGVALTWTPQGESKWRFTLRDGVKFHDGTKLTAEDVAFSILRAKNSPYFRNFLVHVSDVVVVDPLTIDVVTSQPNPTLAQNMTRVFIMSKAWTLEHGLEQVPELAAKEAYSLL